MLRTRSYLDALTAVVANHGAVHGGGECMKRDGARRSQLSRDSTHRSLSSRGFSPESWPLDAHQREQSLTGAGVEETAQKLVSVSRLAPALEALI